MTNQIEIIEFSDELSEFIKTLNYEWLEKYFKLEDGDIVSLNNPKEEIIDNGGYIFYIKLNQKIVGTVSLLKMSSTTFELSKMAVTSSAKGLGLGTKLIEHCLTFSKSMGIERLIIYSNTQLLSALHLYKKFNFLEIEMEEGLYDRANIKLEKYL